MTYFSTLPDTLLVDGTDIQSLTGIVVTSIELFAPGDRRGENVPISGRNGVIGVPKVYDAYEFSVGITILSDDSADPPATTEQARRAQMIANLRAAAAPLVGTGGLVTLTRRLSTGASTSVDHTAAGEFNNFGTSIAILNVETGQTELSFTNLDGCWFASGAPSTPIVP